MGITLILVKGRSKSRRWTRLFILVFATVTTLLGAVIAVAYYKQDELLAEAQKQLNNSFKGKFQIEDSHISPFENFPYISIDFDNVNIYETKRSRRMPIVHVDDIYIGFDAWSIINGNYEVKKIKLSNGGIQLVQYENGELNLGRALSPIEASNDTTSSETTTSTNFKLESIALENIDVMKLNRMNDMLFEVFIENAESGFSILEDKIEASLDTDFLFNLIIKGDTSFLHDKHLSLNTALSYDLEKELLNLSPSELLVESASFLMEGSIDVKNDLDLDLKFSGQKPNFDLFLAFAPPELDPVFSRYENGGQVYFNATVAGPSYGTSPHIEIDFGCEEAFVENTEVSKAVNELFFKGHFTNGELNTAETMALTIEDFSATPETGKFDGAISVKNFDAPDIEMSVSSEFNLDFLVDFLSLDDLEDVSGKVILDMNFHDIIDLDDPSKAIERLNESYFTELTVENLSFSSPDFHLPIKDLNIKAEMDGHKAVVEQFSLKAGQSDISITADISDLPAILHHTDIPVDVNMNIESNLIDIYEITKVDSLTEGFNEQVKNFTMGFQFKTTARAFTESPYLPLGEFFIKDLYAGLTNYPHELHDFNADVIIDSTDFNVIDFRGMLDQSDFHFNGRLNHYDLWFQENPNGKSIIDFDLDSKVIQLQDVFSYNGENYVPEDYRSEEFQNVLFHGHSEMTFENNLKSVNLSLDPLSAYMKEHGVRLKGFAGEIYADSTELLISDFGGSVGNSSLTVDANIHLKQDSIKKPHTFKLTSPNLDFDQLFSYIPAEPDEATGTVDHEDGFNIFEVPFTDLEFEVDIDKMNYHKYLLEEFKLKGNMQENHYIYIDTMRLNAAGGQMRMNGYFNGSNPEFIYLKPNMELENIDLDKLLFKFDNFGQDQLISDNLHGKLTGAVSGIIHVHPDLVPAVDEAELDIDIEVVQGSLVNFSPFSAMSSFFTDKNLNLVRFDTLKNNLKLQNGDLIIPKMNLNTSLGYFEISGTQGVDLDMEYDMRIPLKVIARAGVQKIFGRKNRDNSEQVDDIIYRDETRKTRFVNINIKGTPDDYDIALKKAKRNR